MNVLPILAGFLTALAIVPPAIHMAHRLGAVDSRNPDVKTHTCDTPLLGGMSIIAGTLAAAYFAGIYLPLSLTLAWLFVVVLGLYKDITRKDLAPLFQLAIQLTACALIAAHSDIIASYGIWQTVLMVIGGACLINAINFIDVMDGLCASVAALIALGFALTTSSELGLALAAACLGFFVWNRPKASIFMGDVGSFFIGVTLFHLAVSGLSAGRHILPVLFILAVPLIELLTTVSVRLSRGKSITAGDASHISLIMLNHGVSPWVIISLFTGTGSIFIIAGHLVA